MSREIDQITRALEQIGFKRAHFSVRRARSGYNIEVISNCVRFLAEVKNTTTDERLVDYLRRKLPCPTGHYNGTVSDFMVTRDNPNFTT